MGHAVHLRILYAVWGHPQGTDEVIVGTPVCSTVERIHHHDHHLVAVGLRRSFDEPQSVAKEMIERLHTVAEVLKVERHWLALKLWRIAHIVTKAVLPHEDKVICLKTTLQRPP